MKFYTLSFHMIASLFAETQHIIRILPVPLVLNLYFCGSKDSFKNIFESICVFNFGEAPDFLYLKNQRTKYANTRIICISTLSYIFLTNEQSLQSTNATGAQACKRNAPLPSLLFCLERGSIKGS